MGVFVKAKRQIQNFHNTFFEGGKTLHSLIDGATMCEIPSVYLNRIGSGLNQLKDDFLRQVIVFFFFGNNFSLASLHVNSTGKMSTLQPTRLATVCTRLRP